MSWPRLHALAVMKMFYAGPDHCGSGRSSAETGDDHERGWLGKVKGLQTSLAAEGASFAGAGTGYQRVRMPNLTPTCDQHLWEADQVRITDGERMIINRH